AGREARSRESLGSAAHELELACSPEEAGWRAVAVQAAADRSPGPNPAAGEKEAEEAILQRKIGEFTYQTTPSVFFQANHFLVAGMVETVKELAQDAGREAALDLYSGIGLFALPMARQFSKVIAVEGSQAASRLCVMNAEGAGLENVETVCSEVESWMDAAGSVSPPAFDFVVLDPPRSGAGKGVMERLIEWVLELFVY